MKKLTLLMGALMIVGATFAHDGDKGKSCCKKGEKKECCKKGNKDCKKETTTEKKES